MRRAIAALALLALAPVPALAQQAHSCEPADLAALDGWRGVWIAEGFESDISGRLPGGQREDFALLGFDAPWNDRGWAAMEALIRYRTSGTRLQNGWGYPMMMDTYAPLKFIISPKETVIASQYREFRYIPTDGAPMVPEDERWPTIWGTSNGCWEGDTLVVETVSVGFFFDFNDFTPQLSEDARFIERLRMIGPDRIENIITINDPATLTGPWTTTVQYKRHTGLTRMVHDGDMIAANRIVVEDDGSATFAPFVEPGFPPAPDFPAEVILGPAELARFVGTYALDNSPPGATLVLEQRGNRLFAAFAVPEGDTVAFPLYADGEGTFHSRAFPQMILRFTADEAGTASGLSGTRPNGMPIAGRRLE